MKPDWVRTLFTFALLARRDDLTPGQRAWVERVAVRLRKLPVPEVSPDVLAAATPATNNWTPFAPAFPVNALTEDPATLLKLAGVAALLGGTAMFVEAVSLGYANDTLRGLRDLAGKAKQLLTGIAPLAGADRLDRAALAELKNLQYSVGAALAGAFTKTGDYYHDQRVAEVAGDPEKQRGIFRDIDHYKAKIAARDAERDRGRYRIFGGKAPKSDNCGTGAGGFRKGNTCAAHGSE